MKITIKLRNKCYLQYTSASRDLLYKNLQNDKLDC